MSKLTNCMALVKSLSERDVDAVNEALDAYRKAGMPAAEAQVRAVEDALASLADERQAVTVLARAAVKPKEPEPAAEPAEPKEPPKRTTRTRAELNADRKAKWVSENPFRAFIGESGGVAMEHQKEITGETGRLGNRMLPYFGPYFRKAGLPLDMLVERAIESGWMTQADVDNPTDTGGTRGLADMIADDFRGLPVERRAGKSDAEYQAQRDRMYDRYEPETDLDVEAELQFLAEEWADAIDIDAETLFAHPGEGFTDAEIDEALGYSAPGEYADETAAARADDETDSRAAQDRPGEGRGTARQNPEESEGFLTQPTEAELRAREDTTRKAQAEQKAEQDRLAAAEKKAREDKDIASRQEASAENFQLGQTAEESLAGQGNIFDAPPVVEATVNPNEPEGAQKAADDAGLSNVQWKRGKGFNVNKWQASTDGVFGNFESTAQESVASLKQVLDSQAEANLIQARVDQVSKEAAEKIRAGKAPSAVEWTVILGANPEGGTVDQPIISPFLTQYLGVPANNIKGAIGKAAGVRRTDGGAEYPIVYLGRLPEVLKTPELQPPAGIIENVGEALPPARRDRAPSLDADLTDEFIAQNPLSKIWPAEEIDGIQDKHAAAVAHAARAEIPSKPVKSYKLRRWVEQVKTLRGLAGYLLRGSVDRPRFEELLAQKPSLTEWYAKVRLLEVIDREQWKRIGKVGEYPQSYRYEGDQKILSPMVLVEIDGRSRSFEQASTIADVLDRVNEALGVAPQPKRMQFEVRGSGTSFRINKKGDPEYRALKTFTDSKQAFAFIKDRYDELITAWEDVKASDNVKEKDLRSADNRPRTGADHRKGKDVSAEDFRETFGFKGVEFGSWVNQGAGAKDRQGMVNQAFDAFYDLASLIGIPPKAISLNGTLGVAFGSRGNGWASAHYEPTNLVINLTKTRGAGTLAHEWFHAMDNYFGRLRGVPKFNGNQAAFADAAFITHRPEPMYVHKEFTARYPSLTRERLEEYAKAQPDSPKWKMENWQPDPKHPQGVRPEVEQRFADLVRALDASPMKQRSAAIDKSASDGYWSRTLERAARAFENYVIAKMTQNGYQNDFLANVTQISDFQRSSARYPYLLPEEVAPVAQAFDTLFGTIQTREQDGNVAMFSLDSGTRGQRKAAVDFTVEQITQRWKSAPRIRVIESFDQAGDNAQKAYARLRQGGATLPPAGYIEPNGDVTLVADRLGRAEDVRRVLFHEVLGHYGLRGVYGDYLDSVLDRVAGMRQADVMAKARQYGLDWNKPADRRKAAEEVLAEMAQTNPQAGLVKRAIAAIRQWLRDLGLKLELSDNDIAVQYLLPARGFVEKGQSKSVSLSTAEVAQSFDQPRFVSTLEQAIGKQSDRTMPGDQWAAWLNGNAAKFGIKADEIEWSGVKEYLSLRAKDKVSKADVLDYLSGNGVRVTETVLSDEAARALPNGWRAVEVDGEWMVLNASDNVVGEGATRAEAIENSQDETALTDNREAPKFGKYRVPGQAENYREVLVTLPAKDTITTKRVAAPQGWGDTDGGDIGVERAGDNRRDFRSSHWDQPNVLVHLRVDDRTDADGNRVLFVNELQSDWGQKGRDNGFQSESPPLVQPGERTALTQKISEAFIQRAIDSGISPDFASGVTRGASLPSMARAVNMVAEYDDLVRREAEARKRELAVPPAPFVTDTKSWVALGIKRALMMAVDGGYDKVAFVTGQQAADMFDLSKQVDSIKARKLDSGQFVVYANKGGAQIFQKVADRDQLPDLVGKDLATKIVERADQMEQAKVTELPPGFVVSLDRQTDPSNPYTVIPPGQADGRPLAGRHATREQAVDAALASINANRDRSFEFSGLDLKVGGEGMKAFYDTIVPSVVKDVAKKLGGEPMTVANMDPRPGDEQFGEADTRIVEALGEFGERGYRTTDGTFFETYADAVQHEQGPAKVATQPAIAITPAMREKVRAGVPLFSLKQDQTQTPEFQRWFGDSKVVDADGKPLVVYHGTTVDFTEFQDTSGEIGRGIYFSPSADTAWMFASRSMGEAQSIMPVYLQIRNPLITDDRNVPRALGRAKLQKQGYDGVIFTSSTGDVQYLVFRPEQIKSATGNTGAFDPGNPDIRFSLETPGGPDRADRAKLQSSYSDKLLQWVSDHRVNRGKFGWWRGINTQYHKATLDADFKRVYDRGGEFAADVSKMASEAADLAPSLLPNIQTWQDIAKKQAVSATDMEAVSAPIFEGTLAGQVDALDEDGASPLKGTVWNDAELRERFKLNDRQIGLYREFRLAIDRSLDDMGKSEILRRAGEDVATPSMRADVMGAADVGRGSELLTKFLREQRRTAMSKLRDARKDAKDAGMGDEEVEARQVVRGLSRSLNDLDAAIKAIEETAQRVTDLKKAGYAPLMRFGRYSLWIHKPGDGADSGDATTYYYETFESLADANRRAREILPIIQEQHPDAVMNQGLTSEQAYKLFQGIGPDTLEVFGHAADLKDNPLWKDYIELVASNRSALKRLLERKGTPGFSQDSSRVLAQFIVSNARLTAGNLHSSELLKAVEEIPQSKGDIKDDAVRLVEYLRNPQEEAQKLRGLMFTWFLGGSLASAAVNLTQPITMTFPYLSQFEGAAAAGKRLLSVSGRIAKGTITGDTLEALKRAEADGIVAPQEIHYLQAEANKAFATNIRVPLSGGKTIKALTIRKALFAWGLPFQMAELFNRRLTFVAAYEQAKERGLENPFAFAEQTVVETQGTYSKNNRPNWARGPIGATVFCVDEATQALTQRGWLGPDDLRPGDMMASFDMTSGRLKWMPLQEVHISDYSGEMVHATARSLDMLTTLDHRVVHYKRRRKPAAPRGTYEWQLGIAEAQDVPASTRVQIPTAAPFDHIPVGDPIPDALAPIIGWVVTEGHILKQQRGREEWGGQVYIAQNEGEQAQQIRADLAAAGLSWRETVWNHKNGNAPHIRFCLKKSETAALRALLPCKHLSPELVMRMSKEQLSIMVDRMIRGDGSTNATGSRSLIQNAGPTLESFQMALTILGKSYRVSRHGPKCMAVLIREPIACETGRFSIRKKTLVPYNGRVWCPIVPQTCTWVARRGGVPFITHNTFKQYSIAYVEFVARLLKNPQSRKSGLLALGVLVALSGVQGLPGADDLDDVVDTLAQAAGYNWQTKMQRQAWAYDILGEHLGGFALRGLSSLPFAPIDVQQRMGLGNLFPGTGLFLQTRGDTTKDLIEPLGVAGSLLLQAKAGAEAILSGEPGRVASVAAPVAIANAAKGWDMLMTGKYRDTRGRTVTDVDAVDAGWKAIGFQPAEVGAVQRSQGQLQGMISQVRKVESEIAGLWAAGIFERDQGKVDRARERLQDWNQKNPETPIKITTQQIYSRVKAISSQRADRIIRSAPAEMKAMVRESVTQ